MRKKYIGILIVLMFSISLLFGCQQAQTTSASSNLFTADEMAALCGTLTALSLSSDDKVVTTVGISSVSIKGLEAKLEGISELVLGSDNWWNIVYTYSSYDWNIYFRAKDTSGDWITTDTLLTSENIDAYYIYTVLTLVSGGDTMTLTMGNSKDAPMVFGGLVSSDTPRAVNGPVTLAGTSDGTNYTISMTYDDLSINASGYPMFGAITFSVTEGGSETYAGNVTFDGGNTAVLAFTTGSTSSYLVNVDTGVVASL